MESRAWIRKGLLAVVLGVAWPFVMNELFAHSGGVTVVLARIATTFDLGRASTPVFVRAGNTVIWSVVLGAAFCAPLGLIARTKLLVYWAVFVCSLLIVSLLVAVGAPRGIEGLILSWGFPEYWLYVLAVLAFAFGFSSWLGYRRFQRAPAP